MNIKEWSCSYNSFNSFKGLLYRKNFDGIISGNFEPPVEVNIDPCGNCNLFCVWCNGKQIIDRTKEVMMPEKHLLDLIQMCSDWGVRGICFAGGGEPTMNPELVNAIAHTSLHKMDSAIITNGLFMNDEQAETIAMFTRWAGISVDAATPDTYRLTKGADRFVEVIKNIKKLVSLNAREVTFKFLVHPLNQFEIYDACRMARVIGATGFHARLISERYLTPDLTFDYNEIERQMNLCRDLETDDFNVFTIIHKQEDKGNRRIRFDKCKASPLLCMLEADGSVSVCIDRKGYPETTLCQHDDPEEVRKTWGSDKHKAILDKICPDKDCPKCTLCLYNELLEAYRDDLFSKNFP